MSDSHEAYKDKDLELIKKRKNNYELFLKWSKQFKRVETVSQNCKYVVYPSIQELDMLEKVLRRLSFALPKSKHITLYIPISNKIHDNQVEMYVQEHKHIVFLDENNIKLHLENSIVLINDMNEVNNLDFFEKTARVEIIDQYYYSDVEAETLRKLLYQTLMPEIKREYSQVSKENFTFFRRKNVLKKQVFCFTSGPSFDQYQSFDFPEDSLKIICNSIVKNSDFLNYIGNVDLLMFADPVFHFGPSTYAESFRQDMIKLVKKNDTYIVVPESNVPLLLSHYPELKNKIIGLGINSTLNFPHVNNFYVKGTANILTLFMLPMASAIADTIFLIGADGRQSNEKYFWKHSESVQYNSDMEDAFKMHPSFFRDRNYEDYYDNHCETVEKLISFGEAFGKVYVSITHSYIPALSKRWIDFKQNSHDINIEIEEIREKNRELKNISDYYANNIEIVNYNFATKFNTLHKYIQHLQDSKYKIAIYGNGLIGQLIAKEVQDKLVVIIDQNPHSSSSFGQVHLPEEINNFKFDKLVITALGREESIIKSLNIDAQKVFILDLTKKEPIFSSSPVFDTTTYEYKETNLVGPYIRDSNLSIDETTIIANYLDKKAGVMFDVGAHFGSSAKMFLENGWKVYCYEPDPENRKKLEHNLEKYENLVISDKAISNEAGNEINFYNSNESTGISSLIAFSEEHKKLCTVKTTTLEAELNSKPISYIDFLKIDTEGYDLMVLKGFPWKQKKPLVIECEYEDFKTNQLGYSVYDTIDFLIDKGYSIYVSEWHPIIKYGIRHQWKRFFKYDNQVMDPKGWGNLIAFLGVPDEKKLVNIIDKSL